MGKKTASAVDRPLAAAKAASEKKMTIAPPATPAASTDDDGHVCDALPHANKSSGMAHSVTLLAMAITFALPSISLLCQTRRVYGLVELSHTSGSVGEEREPKAGGELTE